MDRYVIPPELDFLTFHQPLGSKKKAAKAKINPFVMYMFEFKHTLTDQDLADIWQGLMPDISRNARLSNADGPDGRVDDEDDNIFSHPLGPNEFFHGKRIPEDIRWMVFKVKRKANFDYYKVTADASDDDRFDFKFDVGEGTQPYSYNWPYDYFSLVELVQLEAKSEYNGVWKLER